VIEVEAEEEEEEEESAEGEDAAEGEESEDADVEDEEDVSADTKMVEKTVWDWEIINANKPIWTRQPKVPTLPIVTAFVLLLIVCKTPPPPPPTHTHAHTHTHTHTHTKQDVEDAEYNKFYAAFTSNEGKEPLAKIHFTAEGEVTFRSILFVPHEAPSNLYGDYGKKRRNIKMCVLNLSSSTQPNVLLFTSHLPLTQSTLTRNWYSYVMTHNRIHLAYLHTRLYIGLSSLNLFRQVRAFSLTFLLTRLHIGLSSLNLFRQVRATRVHHRRL
jgi:hypothetical protein